MASEHLDDLAIQAAYAAGYFDTCKGRIQDSKCICECSEPGPAERFKARWGGMIRYSEPTASRLQPPCIWEVEEEEACRFLVDILPYLQGYIRTLEARELICEIRQATSWQTDND